MTARQTPPSSFATLTSTGVAPVPQGTGNWILVAPLAVAKPRESF